MSRSPTEQALIKKMHRAALKAFRNAYAPYSEFFAGSAVRAASGKIYTGCNVENASLGATICAERNAISAAVAAGERKITQVLVVVSAPNSVPPCGICRQFIAEFGANIPVYLTTATSDPVDAERRTLDELLPGRALLGNFLPKGRARPLGSTVGKSARKARSPKPKSTVRTR